MTPNHPDLQVRREALLAVTLVGAIASAFYLALGMSSGWQSRLYPWDGLWMLAVSVGFGIATWKFSHSPIRLGLYAAWFLALASQPLFYASQSYGIQHPVMALFVLSILAGGLLVSSSTFLYFWVGFFCLWVVLTGIGQYNERWNSIPITVAEVIGYSAFWSVLYIGSGGLGWFFGRYLKIALDSSHQQRLALSESLNALIETPQLEPFLGRVLGNVAQQFQGNYAPLFLYDAPTGTLQFHLAYMAGTIVGTDGVGNQAPAPIPAQESPLWQELVATRKPVLISDPTTDPRILNRALLESQGVRTLLAVPLVLGERVLGYFALNSLEVRRYQREELESLHTLTQLITLAVQLTRLAEQGEERAILEERNRMAREIHDTLAQGFTGIVMQLEAAEDALEEGANADTHLARAKGLARESLGEARRSVRALRPAALESGNWIQAFKQSVQRLTPDNFPTVQWEIAPQIPPLAPRIENELYRMVQEAFTNVIRHANATTVQIRIRPDSTDLIIEIEDNGIGFDTTLPATGFGVVGMGERATKIGASSTITSRPTIGTTVRIAVPIASK